MLALYPAFGFGQLARTYLVNLMIFNAWGLLYSIFGALMAAINMNSVSNVLNSGNFIGAFNGVTGSLLLGLASILLSLCIALIPFLARRIVEGDVGQTMTTIAAERHSVRQAVCFQDGTLNEEATLIPKSLRRSSVIRDTTNMTGCCARTPIARWLSQWYLASLR